MFKGIRLKFFVFFFYLYNFHIFLCFASCFFMYSGMCLIFFLDFTGAADICMGLLHVLWIDDIPFLDTCWWFDHGYCYYYDNFESTTACHGFTFCCDTLCASLLSCLSLGFFVAGNLCVSMLHCLSWGYRVVTHCATKLSCLSCSYFLVKPTCHWCSHWGYFCVAPHGWCLCVRICACVGSENVHGTEHGWRHV